MTTLLEIRDLDARLHSHFLEWSDTPLQNELLFLLDELQELHGELDKCDVPQTGQDGLELNLRQRLFLLATRQAPPLLDFYGKPQEPEVRQEHLL